MKVVPVPKPFMKPFFIVLSSNFYEGDGRKLGNRMYVEKDGSVVQRERCEKNELLYV